MKNFRNLFIVIGICLLTFFTSNTVNAENWIAKDNYYSDAQWDADSVYSDDLGKIINFKMRFYSNNQLTTFIAQIHQQTFFKIIYGQVVDSDGSLLEEGPMNVIYPIAEMNGNAMYYDIINYYNRCLR